ncbi:uncharacterized protein LOC110033856 [Phalaenopsis equestris]|uniref:uncharacterized protein LOC110033856 n=1 Tax=Phalaenopsis equestris TaxID=78828 RepID=UPI0009E5B9C5|nr:uncharacterized protein LOC110033856 [Phalaenopsis equestris]
MSAGDFPNKRVLKHPLHNFSFPTMSWGRHRIFRCVNSIVETGLSDAVSKDMEIRRDGHCRRVQSSTPPAGGFIEKEALAAAATTTTMPWNLRKRRAACLTPGEKGGSRYSMIPPSHLQFGRDDPGRADQMLEGGGQKRRWRFSVSLSREEIEADFYVFKGMKPSRRPQKRPRIVQRKLDGLFPGLWLEGVTLDSYILDYQD